MSYTYFKIKTHQLLIIRKNIEKYNNRLTKVAIISMVVILLSIILNIYVIDNLLNSIFYIFGVLLSYISAMIIYHAIKIDAYYSLDNEIQNNNELEAIHEFRISPNSIYESIKLYLFVVPFLTFFIDYLILTISYYTIFYFNGTTSSYIIIVALSYALQIFMIYFSMKYISIKRSVQ